jgi:hypothetical protein
VLAGDDDVQAPARDDRIHHIADLRLQLVQLARKRDDDVALLPIHGVYLDAEFAAIETLWPRP